jgi:hypothetical protein
MAASGAAAAAPQAPNLETGVTVHDPRRTSPGNNLYVSAHAPEALLISPEGELLHRWRQDRNAVWPELAGHEQEQNSARYCFRRVRLRENGDLLAIYEYTGIICLDVDSRLLWAHQGSNHHALDIDDAGRIHVLGLGTGADARAGAETDAGADAGAGTPPGRRRLGEKLVYDETITVLSPDGEVLEVISLLDCILNSRFAPLLDPLWSSRATLADFLHPNTLQILDGSCADLSPAFARGNILTSFRNLSTVAIIDPTAREVVWALSQAWRYQHDPTLLPGCTMLLFDNLAGAAMPDAGQRYSRVVEFDPISQEVVWSYRGTPEHPFFSSMMGLAQRLANGNTLVTETEYGRAFELTPAGEIVWEFKSPHLAGEAGEFVAILPELQRVPARLTRDFLTANR